MRVPSILALCALLVACASTPPEPAVKTITVSVPIAVPCDPKLGPKPVYPDTPEAVKGAPDIYALVKLILAGRVLRDAWTAEQAAAIDGCSK